MIGIFGGTFDPVHNGHLRIALDALEALNLDHVRLIPLARAVHRDQPETPASTRLAMLEAAVAGHPVFVVDDRELRRGGPSYTVDTLHSLHDDLPGEPLCLLLGGDAFNGFPDWHDPERILELANIAVLQRPGSHLSDNPALAGLLASNGVERLDGRAFGQIVEVPVTQLDIASSDIRRRLGQGLSADFLTPRGVLEIALGHGLYAPPAVD